MYEVIARTPRGRLRGSQTDGVERFLGVRYGEAPFGERRFGAPVRVAGWDGIRDATEFGPTAPAAALPDVFMPEVEIDGDECLNLNIWTPDFAGSGLPVMVWLHGGGNVSGSSAQPIFDGAALARRGVVLVSVNFRLGVEGFALLPDAAANRALLDQIAALTWVQDNIASFGGDPGNVTVFGTSAGAGAVLALISIRTGLFRRAIVQSASPGAVVTSQDARRVTAEIAELAGVEPTAAGFGDVAPKVLAEVATQIFLELAGNPDVTRWGDTPVASSMPLLPVIDGDVLTGHPFELVQTDTDVDLLIGSNSDELLALITRLSPDLAKDAEILTDYLFRQPILQIARTRTRPTFVYEFAWPSPLPGVGAAHGLELGFVFGNLGVSTLEGPQPPQDLVERVQAAWVAFATTGDPGWPAYTLTTDPVRIFNE
jgi:para-nitrobenzyl esterase